MSDGVLRLTSEGHRMGRGVPAFDVSWSAPRPIAPEWRDKLRSQVLADAHSVGFAPEPYAFGKQVPPAAGGGGPWASGAVVANMCSLGIPMPTKIF